MVYVEASMKEMRQIVEEGPRADLAPDSQVQKKNGNKFFGTSILGGYYYYTFAKLPLLTKGHT